MTNRFKIAELITGKILDELPMTIEGDLTRLLQAYGEGTLGLPLFDAEGELISDTWKEAILPWRSLILVVDDDDRILWHGIPIKRGTSSSTVVRFPCRTIEAYLIRRYVPDLSFKDQDQTSVIFKALVAVAGSSINLEYDCPPSGVRRNREYADAENARVYDRINELAAVDKGFSWTVDVVWGDDDHTFVKKIARTGYPALGNRSANPVHVFELGQNVTEFTHDDDWTDESAATHVRTEGDTYEIPHPSGEEGKTQEMRLVSAPVIDTVLESAGWPRLETRKSFTGVKDKTTIDNHALALAQRIFGGQHIVQLTARGPGMDEDFTRLGDFTLGDTARVLIDHPALTLDEVWPVVGWSLTPETGVYKPVLANIGD